jgi:hypothetical protein
LVSNKKYIAIIGSWLPKFLIASFIQMTNIVPKPDIYRQIQDHSPDINTSKIYS